MTTTQHLYNYDTGEILGPATQEQIEASDAAAAKDGDGIGAIMIDTRTGEVVTPGTFAAQDAASNNAARTVYTF
jgi:hypothetical protein